MSTEAYRRLSPFEQIPAIDDDGVELSESAAIVLYLANKCGRLIPADAAGEAQVLRSGIHDAALLAPYPGVAAYRDRCLARPAWLRVAQAFEQRVVAG